MYKLRKITTLTLSLLMLAVSAIPLSAAEETAIPVYLDGSLVDFGVTNGKQDNAFVIHDYAYVPIARIIEILTGKAPTWNDATKTSSFDYNGKHYDINTTQTGIYIDGVFVDSVTGTPPVIVNSRTLIPLSMLSSAMGFTQNYDETTRSTYLTSPPPTAAPVTTPATTVKPQVQVAKAMLFTSVEQVMANVDFDFLSEGINVPAGVNRDLIMKRLGDFLTLRNAIDPELFWFEINLKKTDKNDTADTDNEGNYWGGIKDGTTYILRFILNTNPVKSTAVKEVPVKVKIISDAPNQNAVNQFGIGKLFSAYIWGSRRLESGATVKDLNILMTKDIEQQLKDGGNTYIDDGYTFSIKAISAEAVKDVTEPFFSAAPKPEHILPDNTPVETGLYAYVITVQNKTNPADAAYRYRLISVEDADYEQLSRFTDAKKPIPVSNGKYTDKELARAVELGFGAIRDVDSYISFAEFMTMLDRTVELADKTKLTAWKKVLPEARKNTGIITRFEAMVTALFCAETLGDKYMKFNFTEFMGDWEAIADAAYGAYGNSFWDRLRDRVIINGGDQKIKAYFADGTKETRNISGAAVEYAVGRVSLTSKESLFEYDAAQKIHLRPAEPLKYSEGLLAALRLYESEPQ